MEVYSSQLLEGFEHLRMPDRAGSEVEWGCGNFDCDGWFGSGERRLLAAFVGNWVIWLPIRHIRYRLILGVKIDAKLIGSWQRHLKASLSVA